MEDHGIDGLGQLRNNGAMYAMILMAGPACKWRRALSSTDKLAQATLALHVGGSMICPPDPGPFLGASTLLCLH